MDDNETRLQSVDRNQVSGSSHLVMLQKSGVHQSRLVVYIYIYISHYLRGFSTIPGDWPWDFWTINSTWWMKPSGFKGVLYTSHVLTLLHFARPVCRGKRSDINFHVTWETTGKCFDYDIPYPEIGSRNDLAIIPEEPGSCEWWNPTLSARIIKLT